MRVPRSGQGRLAASKDIIRWRQRGSLLTAMRPCPPVSILDRARPLWRPANLDASKC